MLHSSSNLVGTVGILCSASTLIGILLFVPLIVYQTNNLRIEIEEMSASFKHSSDHVWDQILVVDGSDRTNQKTATTTFSRIARSPWGKHICQGCHSLTCAVGQPGPGGQPGPDGELGEMGKQGPPGEDGLDVQLQPEGDLPCVICPAGPPGQRGPQGERGRIGEQGIIGEEGPSGKPGNDGPPGNIGPAGSPGQKGAPGRQGQQGDQVIAGVGIKGPQGPPGPAGPKGPHGVPGKSSRDVGLPGKPGPLGPSGLPGAPGLNGEPGGFGPPGEPGEPASYCPSDCGVSHIKAPNLVPEEETGYVKQR